METEPSAQFKAVLERGAQELFEDNQHQIGRAELFTTRNVIADDDLRRFFLGLQHGTVTLVRGARFNTLDRPRGAGAGDSSHGERGAVDITPSTCRRSLHTLKPFRNSAIRASGSSSSSRTWH